MENEETKTRCHVSETIDIMYEIKGAFNSVVRCVSCVIVNSLITKDVSALLILISLTSIQTQTIRKNDFAM